jgi:uncharacterized protein
MFGRVSVAVMIAMVVVPFDHMLLGIFSLKAALKGIPYAYSCASYAFDIVATVILIRMIGGVAFARQWQAVGMSTFDRATMLWALIIFVPATLIMAASTAVDPSITVSDVAFKGFVYPAFEEISFRGLATGILLVIAGWRFLPAAVFPALFFGLAHASQGSDLMEAASLTAITAAGGLLFGWLYLKWNYNLWPPIFLHAGLNTLWMIFDLGNNAIGGWLGNVLRISVVAAAIILTLFGQNWLNRMAGKGAAS